MDHSENAPANRAWRIDRVAGIPRTMSTPAAPDRDRSRAHDIVLWGATGFTGELVAEYLVRHRLWEHEDDPVRLALGGRNEAKLERVRKQLAAIDPRAADLPLVVADSFDEQRLRDMARSAQVIITTVGPYAKYGEALVAACVAEGTDYCDLTGEVPFIKKMVDRHHEDAVKSGVRIVHCCGYDSIPSDIGTWMLQHEAQERHGVPLDTVTMYAGESKGGFSGGTIDSMINLIEQAAVDRDVRRAAGDPYALYPEGEPRGLDGSDQTTVRHDADLGMWTAPFIMARINTRVVRRSNALMDFAYGRGFRYAEVMSTGKGRKGAALAAAITAGLGGFVAALSFGPSRRLLQKRVLPAPGEGPDREKRESGFFVSRLIGKGRDASGRDFMLRGFVRGEADPGYGETAKMLSESALCLLRDGSTLGTPGGITTPAAAMGGPLLERLRSAGMTFRID